MDSEVVQAFNKALVSMYDAKPPISKQKIFDITKAAMNAIRYFKHVVFIVEKFLVKCRAEYKISGLYVIDSIVRQARKQYQHKDVFAPRFSVNLQNTFANILSCDASERPKAVRVINLWLANKIFDEETIEPLLQHCRAMGLEVDTEKVEMIVKGEKANMQIYGAEASFLNSSQLHDSRVDAASPVKRAALSRPAPRTPPLELKPKTPPESSFENSMDNSLNERDVIALLESHLPQLAKLIDSDKEAIGRVLNIIRDRITERLEIERRRQGNIKNLLSREFDYSDEEDDEGGHRNETSMFNVSKEHLLSTARSLLSSNSVLGELQALRQELVTRPHRHSHDRPKTPPLEARGDGVPPPAFGGAPPAYEVAPAAHQTFTAMPTAKLDSFHSDRDSRKRGRSRSNERDHDFRDGGRRNDLADNGRRGSSRDASRGGSERDRRSDRKQRRSRSPSAGADSGKRHRERDERDRRRADEEREREKERERRRNGLPTRPKDAHVLIASRTLWFGRIPSQCTESEISAVVKDVGVPERINVVAPRACAYVTMRERRKAFKIIDRHDKEPIQMQRRNIKVSWATITGLKDNEKLMDYWDVNRGIAVIPFSKLPENLDALLEGAHLDVDTLPENLRGNYDSRGLKGRSNMSRSASQQRHDDYVQPATAAVVTAAASVQPNMFPQAVFQQPANATNVFPFQAIGLPPQFMTNPAGAAPSSVPGLPSNPTAINNGAILNNSQIPQAQQQSAVPFNAAALAGMVAFGFPPPGAPPPFAPPTTITAMAGAPTGANAFLAAGGGTGIPPFSTAPPATTIHQPPQIAVSDEQSAFPAQGNSGFPAQQFGQNQQQFGSAIGAEMFIGASEFGGHRSGARSGRFPQRGADGFRGRGGFGGRGDFNRMPFDLSKRGRGAGNFRGGAERGGFGAFRQEPQNFGTNDTEGNNNGFSNNNRFGAGGRGFGRGGLRGGPFFRGGPPFLGGPPRFPGSQQLPFGAQPFNEVVPPGIEDDDTPASDFDGVDSLFANNRISDNTNLPSAIARSSQNENSATSETGSEPPAAAVSADVARLIPTIPKLSASEMSNLREIIGATVAPTALSVETTKLGGMDEYEDEDDEDYFKALESRAAVVGDESEQPVSTTQPQVSHIDPVTFADGHDARMNEEVSSTTFYDDSEQRAVLTTSAEQPTFAVSSNAQPIPAEEKETHHVETIVDSMPTDSVTVTLPRFGRDVPTDAVEVQVEPNGN